MQPKAQQNQTSKTLALDPIWNQVRSEAEHVVEQEPAMASFLMENILNHENLESAVACRVSERLSTQGLSSQILSQSFDEMAKADANWSEVLRSDISAVFEALALG